MRNSFFLYYLLFISAIWARPLSEDNDDKFVTFATTYERQKQNKWYKDGKRKISDNLYQQNIVKKAKSAVIFVGDGMGMSTVTAARIYHGQLRGMTGEENLLSWEKFPHTAFSKVYNVDMQTPDSAGTATAILSGVKTVEGICGLDEGAIYNNCSSSADHEVLSILQQAEMQGLSTGIVTTARVTHATPACAYSHIANRNWEASAPDGCKDIAQQLINMKEGDGIDVIMGGGRRNFLPETAIDPEYSDKKGKRLDDRNLIEEWQNQSTSTVEYEYVWNKAQFDRLKPERAKKVLGLFEPSHMQYEIDRISAPNPNEPSLTEMTDFAVRMLQRNPKGYVLLVESGRIDHGHHGNMARHALHDTVEFQNAVERVAGTTDQEETLLLVTADHSHSFSLAGYMKRGKSILGSPDSPVALDGKKYTSLGYLTGPGGVINKIRPDMRYADTSDPRFKFQALVPTKSGTHSAEDVGIYARGPQAHLVRGVMEQSDIYHIIDYSMCLTEDARNMCKGQGISVT